MNRWNNVFEARLSILYLDPAKPRIADIVRPLNEACGTDFTFTAVTQRIKHLGLCNRLGPTSLWDDERKAFLVGLVNGAEQISCAEMAQSVNAQFGLSLTRSSICGKINRMKRHGMVSDQPRTRAPPTPRGPTTRPPALCVVPLEAVRPDISIIDLARDECRFPTSSEGDKHFFCGHPQEAGSSYCRAHRLLCSGRGTVAERAASRVSAAA